MYAVTGVDVLKKTLEIDANIRVIVMPGFGSESPFFKEVMELKPCSHAFKPLSEEEFLKKSNFALKPMN